MEIPESGTPAAVFVGFDSTAGAAEVHSPDIAAELFVDSDSGQRQFDLCTPEILAFESFDGGDPGEFAPLFAGMGEEPDGAYGVENKLIKGFAACGMDEKVEAVFIPNCCLGTFGGVFDFACQRFFTSDTDVKIASFGKEFHVGTVFISSTVIFVVLDTADRQIFPEGFIQFPVDNRNGVETDNGGCFAVLGCQHKAEYLGIKGDPVLFFFIGKRFDVGV